MQCLTHSLTFRASLCNSSTLRVMLKKKMGMILQAFEGDRSKNRAGKTLIISYASAGGGWAWDGGKWEQSYRRGKVVATRGPFYGLYHKRAFLSAHATCHCKLEIPRLMAALNRYPFASRREWQRDGRAKLHLGETLAFQEMEWSLFGSIFCSQRCCIQYQF